MQAVIATGGKQYRVNEGDEICVELLGAAVEAGAQISFDNVLLITGEQTKIGTPSIAGASVKATVLDEIRGPKTRCVFYRRRKDSKTAKGHRQNYHKVRITAISA